MNIIKKKLINLHIPSSEIETYGDKICKINWKYAQDIKFNSKLILVTAITPTPFGEGKTTISIGLNDSLNRIKKRSIAALREPSLGPVFGVKGGAVGGGKSLVVPVDKINYHFTGDFHAITSAHNLITAVLEQHIFYNIIDVDLNTIVWKRATDMNDRHLRELVINIDENRRYKTSFQITASSEIMAILCLANNIIEMKTMLENITLAKKKNGETLKVKDLKIVDSLLCILNEAFSPNVVFTKENNLSLIHGGPFANIAHGCNSIISTKLASYLGDYVVTEAGFGSDLGAEKFLNIKVPKIGKTPDAIVLVCTIRALKYHGEIISKKNSIVHGINNLFKHIENLKRTNLPILVTLNKFSDDSDKDINFIRKSISKYNVLFSVSEAFEKGSIGNVELAQQVVEVCDKNTNNNYRSLYNKDDYLTNKIEKIVKKIYGADAVEYEKEAIDKINVMLEKHKNFPICIAKTPNSFTQTASLRGIPQKFKAKIKDIKILTGACMIVIYMGNIIDMPGLPLEPLAQKIRFNN